MARPIRTFLALAVMLLGGLFIAIAVANTDYNSLAVGIVTASVGFVIFGRGLNKGRKTEYSYISIDLIAVVLIAVFFLTFSVGALAGLLAGDQATQNVSHFLLEIEFGGLILALISGVLSTGAIVTVAKFNTEFLYIAGNFASFFVLNLIVPVTQYHILGLAVSPSSPLVFVMIAIPESTVLQIWLAAWLSNVSRTGPLGGSFLAAVIAVAWHFFVYGTNPAKLGIVFGTFFVSNFTAIKGKLASILFTNHLLNNFLSLEGF